MKFIYRSKGSADDWTEDVIVADNKKEAIKKLDEIYGVIRDKQGIQTNSKMIQVEIIE